MRSIARLCVLAAVLLAPAGCTEGDATEAIDPQLAPRGTTMTTVRPTRQDLTNRVSLAGTVTLNPIFGIVAPVAGEVRYMQVKPPRSTPTTPTTVAYVWAKGKATPVRVPAGATFSGRLTDDRSTVAAGMPVVSAKHAGYAIVAEIGGAQAYQISDGLATVQAQITNGPGPFACKVLGTIAALPAGTVPPPPPAAEPAPNPTPSSGSSGPVVIVTPQDQPGQDGSEPTGMRVVCTAPKAVQLINGASATLEVTTKKVTNVLVLPVEAVAGLHGKGQVEVVKPDGTRETRDVELGLTDGKVIEIKSGLTEEETVAVPGPNLPAAPPGTEGQPGFPGSK